MAERFPPPRGSARPPGDAWPQQRRGDGAGSGRSDYGRSATSRGPSPSADEGWGPSTATRVGAPRPGPSGAPSSARSSSAPAARSGGGASPRTTVHRSPSRPADDGWDAAGPAPRDQQRANRAMERQLREMRQLRATDHAPERGLRWWAALLVLIVIALIGGLIDTVGTSAARGGFNIGIVVASIAAILLVKRSHMFPIVIAPPIVYSLAAVFQLYLRSSGLHDHKVVLDAAANYLVYGFPAIASATAAVLIIAGARMILRK